MRALLALGLTLALAVPLGGCGAIIAGTAGGLAAGAVINSNHPPQSSALPPPLPRGY